jgi:hypothetical protein
MVLCLIAVEVSRRDEEETANLRVRPYIREKIS